jgi:hypothetical protein
VRAQTSAASLAASLEILSRFVTSTLTSGASVLVERELPIMRQDSPVQLSMPEVYPVNAGVPPVEVAVAEPTHIEVAPTEPEPLSATPIQESMPEPALEAPTAPPAAEHVGEPASSLPLDTDNELPLETVAPLQASEVLEEVVTLDTASSPGDMFPGHAGFNIAALPAEEQELHRRANRVAKVSMQDIKLLRANDVRLGQENHDLCTRLRDDLEKAHKEYDRRFQTILSHPVDYFYDWLVAILANGDPHLLGEYPYQSPIFRH